MFRSFGHGECASIYDISWRDPFYNSNVSLSDYIDSFPCNCALDAKYDEAGVN